MQINKDRSLTDVALTITHLLKKNLVTTYDAEKILWALLRSVYLYEKKTDGRIFRERYAEELRDT